jgi:hypothetical protein
MTHYALNYLGREYIPRVYDCWVLVCDVYREQYGLDLAAIQIDADNLRDVIRTFKTTDEFSNWDEVKEPIEGDVVLLKQSRHPIHVGVWINCDGGGLLHCVKGNGVVFQSRNGLRDSGWKIESYWRFRGIKNG